MSSLGYDHFSYVYQNEGLKYCELRTKVRDLREGDAASKFPKTTNLEVDQVCDKPSIKFGRGMKFTLLPFPIN